MEPTFYDKALNKGKASQSKSELSLVPSKIGLSCPRCGSSSYSSRGSNSQGKKILQCKDCSRHFLEEYKIKPQGIPIPGIICVYSDCGSDSCVKSGVKQGERQQYRCTSCNRKFLENPKFIRASRVLPKEVTPEQMYEMDVWDMRVLGFEQNAASLEYTVSFSAFTQDWLKSATKSWIKFRSTIDSLNTLKGKVKSLREFSRFAEARYPGIESQKLSRGIILDFLSYLLKRKLGESERKRKISDLRQFLESCVRFSWADIPKERLIFSEDYPRQRKYIPRFIPQEVLEQIDHNLDALPESIARMVIVVREAGMRVSELCHLKFDCIRQDAKGTWWLDYHRFKSKDEHSVPIRLEVAAVIQEQQQYIRKNLGAKFSCLFCETEGSTWFRASSQHNKHLIPLEVNYFTPIPNEINPNTFRGYLRHLAKDKNIRYTSGEIFPLGEAHRFRHTKGTDMINNGVPIEQVKRYLGHGSFAMTMVYAHVLDETLRKNVEKYWDGGKVINVAGEIVESGNPDLETADMQWFKKNILAQALPNGYCGRPLVKGPCPHANACLTCGDFRTTKEFLGIHKKELEHTEKVLEKAKTHGWQRQVEMNEGVKKNLESIIQSLQSESNEQGKES
jgi:integrase/transposase-like protein